jgi:hypothetical protein
MTIRKRSRNDKRPKQDHMCRQGCGVLTVQRWIDEHGWARLHVDTDSARCLEVKPKRKKKVKESA